MNAQSIVELNRKAGFVCMLLSQLRCLMLCWRLLKALAGPNMSGFCKDPISSGACENYGSPQKFLRIPSNSEGSLGIAKDL